MTTPAVTIPAFTVPSFVVTIIIAALCGAVAQLVVGFTRGGCITSLVVGLIGAILGSWLAGQLHMPAILAIAGIDIIWTIIGAAILTAALTLIMGGRRYGGFYGRYRRRGGY